MFYERELCPECEAEMRWIDDWGGDPDIPNGTFDCSHWECPECGLEMNGQKPEIYYEEERDD